MSRLELIALPRARLEELRRAASQSGFNLQRDDDEAAVEEFANAGMDLHDYQQNFVVNNALQVAFFVPDCTLAQVLAAPPESTVRLATIQELFQAKCLVSAARSKTRDWLDLYLLLRDHGFSMRDFQEAFEKAGAQSQCGAALSRLCQQQVQVIGHQADQVEPHRMEFLRLSQSLQKAPPVGIVSKDEPPLVAIRAHPGNPCVGLSSTGSDAWRIPASAVMRPPVLAA